MADENKNQPQKIENPQLLASIATFKQTVNRENEIAFLKEMLNGRYLVPVIMETPPDQVVQPGEQVKTRVGFQMLTNPQGEKFIPAFTDHDQLAKNPAPPQQQNNQVAIMTVRDFGMIFTQNEGCKGFVINPFGENMCIQREQLLQILQTARPVATQGGSIESQVNLAMHQLNKDKEQQAILAAKESEARFAREAEAAAAAMEAKGESLDDVQADAPAVAENPQELCDALSRYLKKQKNVKKAYLQLTTDGTPRYMIAVECDEDQKATFAGVTAEAKEYTALDVKVVATGSPSVQKLVESEKPFYEKKRFGIF